MTTNSTQRTPPPGKNRLAFEKSPYLLQHADNPVDWYPWGAEAFEKAKRESKPVFLSIGYSTCHWCHVMAHESFEDPAVAALMNETFVNIKVDREERPDIDGVYMTVCQMMRGNGGWPLTVIMTPDARPFFAATYIPKTAKHGLAGMNELIPQIRQLWHARKNDALAAAEEITNELARVSAREARGNGPGRQTLDAAYSELAARFDSVNGGFGRAPKFPAPHNLIFLLRRWRRTADPRALDIVEKTLQSMAAGGIYDHVGFGFHRYSVDERWFAPHFEKMIYDQALLAMAYTECYLATGKAAYRRTAEEVLAYVLRDLTDATGGFHSAEDADSEGIEGKFYLWTTNELLEAVGEEDGRLLADVYGADAVGNFANEVAGGNILYLRRSPEIAAREIGLGADELRARLENLRRALFAARERRVRPHRDDKILADWNGLIIAALAKAACAFDDPRYAGAADAAARFVLRVMKTPDGRLFHRYRDGEVAVPGNLDDYAFVIWGLIELYETTFDPAHLDAALDLAGAMVRHFHDPSNGGFYFAPDDGERMIVRSKEIYDGAVPSGNSAAAFVLVRLARITGDHRLEEQADGIGRVFADEINRAPSAFTFFMTALDTAVGPSREIVIVGDPAGVDTRAMIRAVRSAYAPEAVVLLKSSVEEIPRITRIARFTSSQTEVDGKATAYVCENYTCSAPTTDAVRLAETLRVRASS